MAICYRAFDTFDIAGGICPSRLHGSGIICGDAKIFRDRSFPVKLGDKTVVTMLWFVGVKERASFLFFLL